MASSKKVLVFLLLLATLAAVIISTTATETCVPTMQRLLSCLDFIEHRSDDMPPPCCAQLDQRHRCRAAVLPHARPPRRRRAAPRP
ncbi:hypothetical protein ABZP36_000205 [Zizania latifolia]